MAAEPNTLPSNLPIGTVCRRLGEEFDDISISKIRFLEDQKLITPRRTPGGYRLFSADDVERLRAILRMQRDEFLPLAVIRDLLTQGASRPSGTRRRRARALAQADRRLTREELASETDADLRFIQELEEYQLLEGRRTAPSCSIRSILALAVPPVASRSSCTSTRAPLGTASTCISSASKPYSSAYFAPTVRYGSLPGLRAATKPQPSLYARAEPRMKPRASAPTT